LGLGRPWRVLASRTLTGLGVISNGILLWQCPLLKAIAASRLKNVVPGSPLLSLALFVLPMAIAYGWLSYRGIERPAMRLAAKRP
jgi:peptidoglycan/LPS O-acetylase OafA/YrhL